jgi:hypothetical protein
MQTTGDKPITQERSYAWQASLFQLALKKEPNGKTDISKIT